MNPEPVVILLGGVPGTGKTTIASLLVQRLGLSHHLSTGFIRASVQHLLPESQSRLLRRHAFDAWEELPDTSSSEASPVLQGVLEQATILKPSIEACVRRAVREGIGLVVEGSHLLPGLLDLAELGVSLLCVLDVSDRENLRSRALSSNHSRRTLSEEQLTRLLLLQEEIVSRTHGSNHAVIMNDRLPETVDHIQALLDRSSAAQPRLLP